MKPELELELKKIEVKNQLVSVAPVYKTSAPELFML